ncbi:MULTISPECIES: FAD-dependent oxidoreductase [unclassified Streptomyces]|uniref:FAD-dependent oxidoreductase n=1 Tax=unclassified Streptomyces TaxID=2593676 RepID=UPI00332111DF
MTAHRTPRRSYDLVVVGGGAIGLSTAWYAAERGASVLVLESGDGPENTGSSTGDERQWRVQYTQRDLTELTVRALPLWRRLEEACGRRLVHHTGSLWFGETKESTNEGQIADAAQVLDDVGLRYEWLTATAIEERFGFTGLPSHYEGFHQPDGGVVDVRGTLWSLAHLARAAGAEIRAGQRVLALEPHPERVEVVTADARITADKVVVTAGPWTNELTEPLGVRLDTEVYDMATAYFRLRDPARDLPTWFAFQTPTDTDSNLFYGFGTNPWGPGGLVRVAPDFESDPRSAPPAERPGPDPHQLRRTAEFVARHMPMLDPEPVRPGSCLIALPRDHGRQFYLGALPPDGGRDRILVQSAGWAFKFVPVFGDALARLALDGDPGHPVERFRP